jgi:plastocyanin
MPISFRKGAMSLVAITFAISGSTAFAQSQIHNVLILDQAFFPGIIYVAPGDTLNFLNDSDAVRTVRASDGTWESEALGTGGTFSYIVNSASPLMFSSSAEAGAPVEGEETPDPAAPYEGTISFDEPPLTE